jgi:lysophospholipase L1-like esterase
MSISFIKRISRIILVLVLLLICSIASAFTVPTVHAASQIIPPTDHHIKYVGRWDTSSRTVYTSYWVGAYFETQFTGTTVAIQLATSVSIYVKIDKGDDTFYPNANGTVNLTPTPLAPGTHLLRVAASADASSIAFQGLVLDAGAKTVAPKLSSKLIEFIGDSITAGYTDSKGALSDYAWLIGEQLGVQHTQIAYSGICLVDHVQCPSPNSIGMSKQVFKLQTVLFPNSPDWDFSRYQASAVVINLGTNDSNRVADDAFQSSYESFLRNIRKIYPKARIFVLRTFAGIKAAPTQAAIQAVGDSNVQYVDTTGWVSPSDTNDGIHPSNAGHAKIAQKLGPIIETYLKTLASPAALKKQHKLIKKKKKHNQRQKVVKSAAKAHKKFATRATNKPAS